MGLLSFSQELSIISFSLFDDPNREARLLYVKYWQNKLADNKDVEFPESLAEEIADTTNRFSFAYLKEAL